VQEARAEAETEVGVKEAVETEVEATGVEATEAGATEAEAKGAGATETEAEAAKDMGWEVVQVEEETEAECWEVGEWVEGGTARDWVEAEAKRPREAEG
jgi:hypothetical protein